MKERVEAAFIAQESSENSNAETEQVTTHQVTSPSITSDSCNSGGESQPEPEENVNKQLTLAKPGLPSSEESSNEGSNDMKIKNTILRTCFGSLVRRQKLEKEQEYHQYLNGFD